MSDLKPADAVYLYFYLCVDFQRELFAVLSPITLVTFAQMFQTQTVMNISASCRQSCKWQLVQISTETEASYTRRKQTTKQQVNSSVKVSSAMF